MTKEEAKGNLIHALRWNDIPKKEALEMAIKALEQNLCDDAISRAQAIYVASGYCHPANIAKELEKLPSVNPQKSVKWVLLDECANSGYYCSECHKKLVKEGWSNTVKKIKFCTNCGAKMEVEE